MEGRIFIQIMQEFKNPFTFRKNWLQDIESEVALSADIEKKLLCC